MRSLPFVLQSERIPVLLGNASAMSNNEGDLRKGDSLTKKGGRECGLLYLLEKVRSRCAGDGSRGLQQLGHRRASVPKTSGGATPAAGNAQGTESRHQQHGPCGQRHRRGFEGRDKVLRPRAFPPRFRLVEQESVLVLVIDH